MSADLCPGKFSVSLKGTYGLCIRCARLDAAGKMIPAVRRDVGVAVCVHWVAL